MANKCNENLSVVPILVKASIKTYFLNLHDYTFNRNWAPLMPDKNYFIVNLFRKRMTLLIFALHKMLLILLITIYNLGQNILGLLHIF